MAATNAVLAFGGMTQHSRRWGWRMFFLASFRSLSRWHDRQSSVPRPFSPTAAGSSARVPWAAWNKPGQSVWLPSRRQKSGQPPVSPVACGSTQPRSLLPPVAPDPVNHRCAGLQRLDNPVVTPAFTGLRHIGLKQYPRLQQALGRALAFAYQRFELLALLNA